MDKLTENFPVDKITHGPAHFYGRPLTHFHSGQEIQLQKSEIPISTGGAQNIENSFGGEEGARVLVPPRTKKLLGFGGKRGRGWVGGGGGEGRGGTASH